MKLIPLEEAAQMLGISSEQLLEMRSNNEIFGYRDGSTWKFKDKELDRVASSLGVSMTEPTGIDVDDSGVNLDLASDTGSDARIADVDSDLDEMVSVEDSGLLTVEADKGVSIGDEDVLELGDADDELVLADSGILLDGSDIELELDEGSGIDLELEDDKEVTLEVAEESDIELSLEGSDVALAATDSDAPLVLAGDSDAELTLEGDDELVIDDAADEAAPTLVGGSDVHEEAPAAAAGGSDFDFDLSDVDLSGDSGVGAGAAAAGVAAAGAAAAAAVGAVKNAATDAVDSDVLGMDGSDIQLGAASDLDLDMSDSAIELDLDGDASSSSLKLDGSGINLTSPSDSGLSLESTPELAGGSDMDALELGEADELDIEADIIDIGDEAVDLEDATIMAGDNDFLLEPVESDMEDVDSGSQIIALDTEEIDPGEDSGMLNEDAFVETTNMDDPSLGSLPEEGGMAAVAPLTGGAGGLAPEIPYSVWNIVGLSLCTLLMAIAGMMMSDLVMNMWSWDKPYSLNSQLMDSVLGIFGMK